MTGLVQRDIGAGASTDGGMESAGICRRSVEGMK